MDMTTYAVLNKKIKEVESKGVSDERLNDAVSNSIKFNELNEQYEHLEQQHNTFETSITSAVNGIESRVTTLENSTGSGGSTGSGTSVDLTNITNRVSTLETRHNNFESTITNSVNDVESRVSTLETNIDNCASSTDLNTLQTKHNNFETSITSNVDGVKSRVTTLETNISNCASNTTVTTLQNQVNSLQTKHNNFETTITDRVEGIESRVSTLESNSGSVSGSGTSDGYGQKLIAHYVHTGNKEIHFSSFDFPTAQGTTTEPHGLTSATEVILAPNGWTLKERNKNALKVPIEWIMYGASLKLLPVDDITLKVVRTDGSTAIPVDINNVANPKINIDGFHFEVPKVWAITELPIKTNYVKIVMKGYIKGATNRYIQWKTKNDNGTVTAQQYFPLFTPPKVSNAVNCIFGIHNFELDFRDELIMLKSENYYEARANNTANLTWNITKDVETKIISKQNSGKDQLSYIGSHSQTYAFNSNNTHVYIYDLGGSY